MWVSTSNSLRGWAWAYMRFVKKFRGRSFWGTKITPTNVHEVTQKMRKWLKKYMNFHSVFWKNYDTRQNFSRPPVATNFMYGAEQKDKTQVDIQKFYDLLLISAANLTRLCHPKMPIPCMHLCQCLFLSINKILLQTKTWNCIKCVCFDHSNKMHLTRWSTSCQCRNNTEFFELFCSKFSTLWFNPTAAFLLSFYIDTT